MTCRTCEMILSAQLEGEATASQWREAEQHMIQCRACAQCWEAFQASTRLLKVELARHEPSEALWEKIAVRIAVEPKASLWERWCAQWDSWTHHAWFGVPRLAYGAGLAIAMLTCFFALQWQKRPSAIVAQPQNADNVGIAEQMPKEKVPRIEMGANDPLLHTRLAQNVAAHFEATRLVLLEVKNNADTPQEFDVAEVRASSQRLLEQSLLLKTELREEKMALLRTTLEQLEIVLFDLANLETQPEPEEITSLRTAIQQGDLLIKIEIIDLEALTREKSEPQPAAKPTRRAVKPII